MWYVDVHHGTRPHHPVRFGEKHPQIVQMLDNMPRKNFANSPIRDGP
jgi:hypothetical protein